MDALSRGSLGDLSPLLPLNLKCRNCDHTATYDVTEVWLTQKTDTPSLFLAEEVACLNCGAISDFEFTTDAFGAITGEALRLGIGRNDADDETDIPSALMVVSFDLGDGIERSDPALRAYRSRLPRLGNTSKFEGVGSDVERG
jgi:hypothetical protein